MFNVLDCVSCVPLVQFIYVDGDRFDVERSKVDFVYLFIQIHPDGTVTTSKNTVHTHARERIIVRMRMYRERCGKLVLVRCIVTKQFYLYIFKLLSKYTIIRLK